MKIVIDDKIPFIKGVFEPYATVLYLQGGQISQAHLADAECLIVRTRTRCNEQLLKGSAVKFIGTATIGFDHIDAQWCGENGIVWTNAPGCNSGGVSQYITAALREMSTRQNFDLKNKTLGIIGVGHVGRKVEKVAHELGMKVILNDPPRERQEGSSAFTNLSTLLASSDIITIHVPLNREGPDKTVDLVDRHFLELMKPGTILINSSRGEVLNEAIVLNWMIEHLTPKDPSIINRHLSLLLDVWHNEPNIDRDLMSRTSIATPHIAGYSIEGKYNATKMIVKAASDFLNLNMPALAPLTKDGVVMLQNGQLADYDIMADDLRLRESPETFEQQRNNYHERWEYSNK